MTLTVKLVIFSSNYIAIMFLQSLKIAGASVLNVPFLSNGYYTRTYTEGSSSAFMSLKPLVT
jgi:hypothetical protein